MMTLRTMMEARLIALMTPAPECDCYKDGGAHLRGWVAELGDDELVDMLATESYAAGHKAGEAARGPSAGLQFLRATSRR